MPPITIVTGGIICGALTKMSKQCFTLNNKDNM